MKLINICEQMVESSYRILSEIININNYYTYINEENLWTFVDRKNVKHFTVIHQKQPEETEINKAIVKFGWWDGNSPSYQKPEHYDEKIFNTHLHVFLFEMLDKFKRNYIEFYLEAEDLPRYRLYRMALNKFLNKHKYDLIEDENEHTLIVKAI